MGLRIDESARFGHQGPTTVYTPHRDELWPPASVCQSRNSGSPIGIAIVRTSHIFLVPTHCLLCCNDLLLHILKWLYQYTKESTHPHIHIDILDACPAHDLWSNARELGPNRLLWCAFLFRVICLAHKHKLAQKILGSHIFKWTIYCKPRSIERAPDRLYIFFVWMCLI